MGVIKTLSSGAGNLVALGVLLIIGVVLIITFTVEGTSIVAGVDSTASTTDITDMKTKIITAFGVLASVVTIGILVLIYHAFIGNKNNIISG